MQDGVEMAECHTPTLNIALSRHRLADISSLASAVATIVPAGGAFGLRVSDDELIDSLEKLDQLQAAVRDDKSFRELLRDLEPLRETLRELAALQAFVLEIRKRMDVDTGAVREALERVLPLAAAQAREVTVNYDQLVETLMTDLDVLDPVPHASVSQAQRIAEARNRLLAAGAWTVSALAEARGTSESTVRTWLTRQRAADRVISVKVQGQVHVPALLLNEATEPYDGTAAILRPLRESGMNAWAVWMWLDAPSPWLDGDRPADLLKAGAVNRVRRAAESQATNAAPATRESDAA